jgi:hypothetical protein
MDNYYLRPEVSNSDLTWLKKYWMPEKLWVDLEKAYANGSLIDAMITEPERVDYFKLRLQYDNYQFSQEDFERAKEMKKAFYRDPFCQQMVKQCSFQHITIRPGFQINYEGFDFSLDARCKWDLYCPSFDLGGDIKSTTATTQKQAEEAVRHFEYDRSRAWYMDLAGRSNDILIFISKVNFKIFKVPVKRNSELYREGKLKYQELAFRYWYLFGDIKKQAA